MASRFLTRRGLFATSGATLAASGPLALTACGETEEDEEISPAREVELLNAVLAQQLGVIAVADPASSAAPRQLVPTLDRLRTLREQSTGKLEREITDLDGAPTDSPAAPVGQAESQVEGVRDQLEASIAASLRSVGELPPEQRKPIHRAISEDAAALAAIRATLGEEIAPDAFVMGRPSKAAA